MAKTTCMAKMSVKGAHTPATRPCVSAAISYRKQAKNSAETKSAYVATSRKGAKTT